MRTIGVISDTHGLLRPEALAALRGSELILHAGDVGGAEILDELGGIAPVRAVRGNTDWGPFAARLPETDLVDLAAVDGEPRASTGSTGGAGPPREPRRGAAEADEAGARRGAGAHPEDGPCAYVIHDLDQLDIEPRAAGVRLVVYGHTHQPRVEERAGVVYLNPGSAGPRRFKLPVSVARVRVGEGGAVEVEIVRLEVGEGR